MKKRVLSIILFFFIALLLTSCFKQNDSNHNNTLNCEHSFVTYQTWYSNNDCHYHIKECEKCGIKEECDQQSHTYKTIISESDNLVKICDICNNCVNLSSLRIQNLNSNNEIGEYLILKIDKFYNGKRYKWGSDFVVYHGKTAHTLKHSDEKKFWNISLTNNKANAQIFWGDYDNDGDDEWAILASDVGSVTINISFDLEYSNLYRTCCSYHLSWSEVLSFVSTKKMELNIYDKDKNTIVQRYSEDYGTSIKLPDYNVNENEEFLGWTDGNNVYKEIILKTNTNLYPLVTSTIGTEGLIYEFDSDSDSYFVSGYNGYYTDVVIPGVYNSKIVSKIKQNAFKNKNTIKTLTIPNTVELIENDAFSGMTSLINVSIDDFSLLLSIGDRSFYNCSSLINIEFSSTILKTLGYAAFEDCSSLEYIHLPKTIKQIGERCFNNTGNVLVLFESLDTGNITFGSYWDGGLYGVKKIIGSYSNVKQIKENSEYKYWINNYDQAIIYKNKQNYDTVELDTIDEYEIIGVAVYAFYNSNLKKLVIGDKVEWLDSYSFMNCKSLIYVDYKETSVLTTIGSKAFSHCENLKFIFIPISVTSIGSYCFEYDIKCWVVFQRLNNNGITLGTKWNGYNDNYLFIVQIDHSIYSSKWDCDYAYYNEKENKIEYRQGNTIGNFPAE